MCSLMQGCARRHADVTHQLHRYMLYIRPTAHSLSCVLWSLERRWRRHLHSFLLACGRKSTDRGSHSEQLEASLCASTSSSDGAHMSENELAMVVSEPAKDTAFNDLKAYSPQRPNAMSVPVAALGARA